MSLDNIGASTARQPDLNWSQIRETILMLGVAIGQIQHAMSDGHDSVKTLAESFANTHNELKRVRAAAQNLPAEVQETEIGQTILTDSAEAARSTDKAIIAFQFYDRMTQRLQHVCDAVDSLAALVSDQRRLYIPDEWVGLQTQIRSKYTMEEERLMFDAILQGMPVKQAIALTEAALAARKAEPDSDLELF